MGHRRKRKLTTNIADSAEHLSRRLDVYKRNINILVLLCANQIETLTSPPPGIPGEFAWLIFEEGGNLTFFSSGRWGICLGGR